MYRDDVMLTCRVPREDVTYIDALAKDAGCSRSEYVRRLLKLPVAMHAETAATLRTSHGARSLDDADARPQGHATDTRDGALGVNDRDGSGQFGVLVLTDVPIRKLCIAIDRWGTNYNQAVRALNALVRRLEGVTVVEPDDARDVMYMLTVCAQGNELAKDGIEKVAVQVRELIGVATIDMRRRDEGKVRPRKRKRTAVEKQPSTPAVDHPATRGDAPRRSASHAPSEEGE